MVLGIKEDHCVLPWLICHASSLTNRYQVGIDGKVVYERWKRRSFKGYAVEIGERIMYLKPGSRGKDWLEPSWEKGVWLGWRDETGETIVGTPGGRVKAKDI